MSPIADYLVDLAVAVDRVLTFQYLATALVEVLMPVLVVQVMQMPVEQATQALQEPVVVVELTAPGPRPLLALLEVVEPVNQ